jgi:hypothetical protein
MAETRHNITSRFEKRKQVWQNQNSFATTLLTIFLDTYGTEAFDWDPLTIQSEVERDFSVKLSRPVFDRLMAGIAIVSTDAFFNSLPDFINLCNVLSGDGYDPTVFDPADCGECAWGMTEALMLSPPDDKDNDPFCDQIVSYLSETLKAEGILTPPDILRISLKGDAKNLVDKVRYDFSDDPDMFNAIFDTEKAKTDEINSMIKDRLSALVQQMEAIPLENGDSTEIVKKLAASLPK